MAGKTDVRVHSGYPHQVAGMGANPEGKMAYASVNSAVIFALVCFGALGFMDGMAGGYALGGRGV